MGVMIFIFFLWTLVSGIATLVMLALGGATYGYAVLQPFIAATRERSQRVRTVQFQVSDLLWLALLIHLPLVFVAALRDRNDHPMVLVLGSLLLATVLYLWFRGATLLSRIGVNQPLRRGVFLVIVLPVAVLGSLVMVSSVVFSIVTFCDGPHSYGVAQDSYRVAQAVSLGLISVLLLAGLGCRRLAHWVVAGVTSEPPTLSDSPSPEICRELRLITRTADELNHAVILISSPTAAAVGRIG